jgi:predicted Fe-Mo cluster-binding NifX family protein
MKVKLALPTSDRVTVDGHFGHTREFVLVDIEDRSIVGKSFVTPPKHEPGVLPAFLADQGANVIVTGGMGAMAVNLFNQYNVTVYLGAMGSIDEVVSLYLDGKLVSRGSVCEHDHEHHGGHH